MSVDRIKLRRLREQADLSQQALADKARVSQQLVAALERGRISTSKHIFKIAAVLGVDASEIDESVSADGWRPLAVHPEPTERPLVSIGMAPRQSLSVPVFGVRPTLTSADFDGVIGSTVVEHVSWKDGEGRFALYAPDESLSPRIEMEDIIVLQHGRLVRRGDCAVFFDRTFPDPDIPDLSAKFSVGIVKMWDDSVWVVEKLNPKAEIQLHRTEWPTALAVAAVILK